MTGGLYTLLGRLRESLRHSEAGALSDAELLNRWTGERDQAAFELLVWRHGRLVLSVCQRLLNGAEDVEDAFQATFLVLARKAGALRRGQALASWLHTVAMRVALEARQRAGRRRPQAGYPLEEVPARPDPPGGELREVIDEEVRRLPEKYRQVFVLCCLEGRTNEEAARELRQPVGTVLSRLSRARQRLRERLARRGLAPSALVGPALSEAAPAGLITRTVEAAVVVAGKNVAAGAVRASVAVLMEGALRGMFIAKVKFVAAVLLSVVVLGAGGGAAGYRALSAGEPGSPGETPRPVSNTKEVDDLRAQLKEAQAQIAELRTALRRAQVGQARPTAGSPPAAEVKPAGREKVPALTPVVDREDLELLKVRADARKADVDAAKAVLSEAQRRVARMERLAANGAVSAEVLDSAKATLARAQAEVRLKELDLQEALIHLKRAERLSEASRPPTGTAPASLEQRVQALEAQLAEMRKELDRVRAQLKPGKSGY